MCADTSNICAILGLRSLYFILAVRFQQPFLITAAYRKRFNLAVCLCVAKQWRPRHRSTVAGDLFYFPACQGQLSAREGRHTLDVEGLHRSPQLTLTIHSTRNLNASGMCVPECISAGSAGVVLKPQARPGWSDHCSADTISRFLTKHVPNWKEGAAA